MKKLLSSAKATKADGARLIGRRAYERCRGRKKTFDALFADFQWWCLLQLLSYHIAKRRGFGRGSALEPVEVCDGRVVVDAVCTIEVSTGWF